MLVGKSETFFLSRFAGIHKSMRPSSKPSFLLFLCRLTPPRDVCTYCRLSGGHVYRNQS